ncbi:glutamyl-tRNA reductase [Hymenobacter sp. H14-R3]|uniref:glutamyl-tRNA reductase n=1 Tax=Hymenobacter sp. H14-R3 TaxID=3046308 RepID=UPI0024B9FF15|nr:glutamyl-tRNA reductase [Hymenobacter sp. H14-R3]MDJ0367660.1 glutamyl-tRNA reductase [Hymenobacter sp. H14-R3]
MIHPFKAVSLSYKNAPLAIREQLALDGAACDQLLHVLQHTLGLTDVLVLGTCNRTEVYYCAAHDQRAAIIAAVGQARGLDSAEDFAAYFTTYGSATAAARHLFDVALGLDAQVVGDAQIGNQVKIAYQRSADAGAAGPFLHRLLHTVFAAHKRVQQETAFHDGAASTASATLALVEALTAAVARPRVLLVGLGEMGSDIGRYFAKSKHFADVVLCNRTPEPAAALAAECGLPVLPFEQLARGLQAADVVISAVAAPCPLFTRELLAGLDILTPKFFIDLSVPRSVEPAAESVPGVLVYNLDAIQRNAATALAGRAAAVPQVQAIIAESLAGLHEWSREMQVSPLIQKLKSTLEQMRQQEVGRFQKQMSADEARRMEAVTSALTQKFLKLPVLQLKAACQRGEADQLVATLTELFALEA